MCTFQERLFGRRTAGLSETNEYFFRVKGFTIVGAASVTIENETKISSRLGYDFALSKVFLLVDMFFRLSAQRNPLPGFFSRWMCEIFFVPSSRIELG